MADVLVRGLDAATLSKLRATARRRGISVNRLILETLQREQGRGPAVDDLDQLAGSWSKAQADAFDAAVAPFGEIDPVLWAAEPRAKYRVKRGGRRRRR